MIRIEAPKDFAARVVATGTKIAPAVAPGETMSKSADKAASKEGE